MKFKNNKFPSRFETSINDYRYDTVFLVEPWESIYKNDGVRYETFDECLQIDKHLKNTYAEFNYKPIIIPNESLEKRMDFLMDNL